MTFSPANYQAMLQGFEGVVQNSKGTALAAFAGFPLSSFPLAGKTGTATTNEQQPNSWFVGWGPVPHPRYLIAVVVQGGGFGSQAAAPVARQGFDYLVAHPESPTHVGPGHHPGRPVAPTRPRPPRPRATTPRVHDHHHLRRHTTTAQGVWAPTRAPGAVGDGRSRLARAHDFSVATDRASPGPGHEARPVHRW